VLATLDSQDWRRPGVDHIIANATPKGSAGQVLLMHDAGGDRAQTVAALGRWPRSDGGRARTAPAPSQSTRLHVRDVADPAVGPPVTEPVSVIIPAFNESAGIKATVRSLVAQHIEYVVGFNLDRRLFDLAECMPTVPGAIGAFRRQSLERVGGVSDLTLAEDTDLTMALCRDDRHVVYEERAKAWTEAPASLADLWRQRYRWC
jgi:cellulose synthase/poly-beta-1,6-N-acetylglucosamine synthase-like glycosyltransferase